MSTDEGKPPAGSEKKARRQVRAKPPIDINREPSEPDPTDRIERAKNEYIKALEKDKSRLLKEVKDLQAMVGRLAPANARLEEAHANAVANNILATILVAIGGGAISFATFVEGSSLSRSRGSHVGRRDPDLRHSPRSRDEAGSAELIGRRGRVRLAIQADGFAARDGTRGVGRSRSLSVW